MNVLFESSKIMANHVVILFMLKTLTISEAVLSLINTVIGTFSFNGLNVLFLDL